MGWALGWSAACLQRIICPNAIQVYFTASSRVGPSLIPNCQTFLIFTIPHSPALERWLFQYAPFKVPVQFSQPGLFSFLFCFFGCKTQSKPEQLAANVVVYICFSNEAMFGQVSICEILWHVESLLQTVGVWMNILLNSLLKFSCL